MAAWVTDMFFNYYLLKNQKMFKNSNTAEAEQKLSADLDSLQF
jgi:hypothetical protein